jgi:eukaryotic-like serine/threonine-protein kinase
MSAVPADREDLDLEREIFGGEEVPEIFAGYRITGVAGRGRSAVVYEAVDPRENRPVALKVLVGAARESAEEVQRFRREAEGAARLDHPNIVRVYEYGEHQGAPYFSMELVEGAPLDELIEAGLVSGAQGLELMEKVARALEYAHSREIIHRDLKPANIVVGIDGQPRVADFGLAKFRGETPGSAPAALTALGMQVGTPCYMAPEQAAGRSRDVDARTDVYAAGCMLYELVAGRRPFDGNNAADIASRQIKEPPVPPRRINSDVSADIEAVILKCLEKSPEQRYATAGELADDLARCLAGKPVRARAGAQGTSPSHRGRALVAVIAVLAAVVGTTAGAREAWLILAAAGGVLLLSGLWLVSDLVRRR